MQSAQQSTPNLPEHLFLNPILTALQTTHARLAIFHGEAARYPAAVSPFAALVSSTTEALRDLHALLTPNEHVWATALGEGNPKAAGLTIEATIDVLQMAVPTDIEVPPPNSQILSLTCAHSTKMVALTDVAFPGFFRPGTCEMGDYYGICSREGQLIAMGGERLVFPGYSEISGLCTHPDYRGQGHATQVLWHVATQQRSRADVPWLHVTATNLSAINLYLKLGLQTVRSIQLYKLRRT